MNKLIADPEEIARTMGMLFTAGNVMELRILKTRVGTVAGYFDNFAVMVDAIIEADAKYNPVGIYYTLNELNPALLARSYNRMIERAELTTSDNNIMRRRWLPVDLDPIRPAGISSSEEEHAAAIERARTIAADMAAEWGLPIIGDSGNGGHLLYPIDLPNDRESLGFITGAVAELDRRYSDEVVKVDTTSANAARIWKAYGTVARKGDSIPARPHRLSRILEVPK